GPCRARAGGAGAEPRGWRGGCSCPLADLPADELALVADALALVRLGRANLADLRRGLADDLLVDAADDDLRRHRHLERDALARLHLHGVRVAHLQLEIGSGHRGTVADTLGFQPLFEAGRDALDHVRDQRAREAVQRPVLPALGRARDEDRPVLLRDPDPRRHDLAELALRTRHRDAAGVDRDEHAGGDFDGLLSDTAHRALPDETDHFAADALALGGAARDDAAGRGQDRGPHAAEHARQPVLAGVDAAARLGDTLEIGQHPLAPAAVLELDDERRVRALLGDVKVADVALFLEDPRDLDLELRVRHLGAVVQRLVGVADAGEHVGNWIGEHGSSYQELLVMPGITPWWASSRRQIR